MIPTPRPSKLAVTGLDGLGVGIMRTLLAGLMALSTYIALPGELAESTASRDLTVFMAHGSFDPMIPMHWGRASADRLIAAGFDVEWHDYPMAHAVCPQEIQDIRAWLLKVYGESSGG